MSTIEKIQQQITENPILLYMKGSPKLPSCGFSAQAVQALIKESAAKHKSEEPDAE